MQASDYSDVFVSYRRKDVEFTKQLVEALRQAGKEVWIDWEDIPPGSEGFSDDIRRGLEGADAFIAILSPDYLESTYCVDLELGNAIKMNKKIIPIVLKKFDDYPIPQGIGHINWIYFTPHAGQENTFDEGFQKVLDTLEIDLEYNREHKRYLLRALEWDNGNRSSSFLLTGDEIDTAESWLMEGASKDPAPTELHTEYIQASRQQEKRRQRMLLAGVSVALVVSVILTILSLIGFRQASVNAEIARANEAEAEAQEALAVTAREEAERSAEVSNSLALASAALQPDNKDISVAMALAATQIDNPPGAAITALMQSAFAPGARLNSQFFTQYPVFQATVSSDLNYIVIGNQMFDLMTDELVMTFESAPDVPVIAQFLPSDDEVIIAGDISFDTQAQQESDDTTDLNLITMGVYSVADGSLIRELSQDAVSSLKISEDGTQVAVLHPVFDEYVIYDVGTGDEITRLPNQSYGLSITPDFTRYAYIAEDDSAPPLLHVADVATQAVLSEIEIEPIANFVGEYHFAINPNGRTVAVNSGQSLTAYDIQSGEVVTVFDNYDASFSSDSVAIDYTPSGKHLMLGVRADSRVNVWDTTTGNLVDSFIGHSESLVMLQAVDNQYIVSVDAMDNVILWDLKDHFMSASFFSQSDYMNPETDEFLIETPNGALTRISLDTFLPTGDIIQIPDDIRVADYDAHQDLLLASRGEAYMTEYDFEAFDSNSLILMSAETGEIITEYEFDVSVDMLDIDRIYSNTTYEPLAPEDIDELEIIRVSVSGDDLHFLSETRLTLSMSFQLSDATGDITANTSRTMLWDTQSNTLTPVSLDLELNPGDSIQVRDNNLFALGAQTDEATDIRETVLLQFDETLEQVNRFVLHKDTTAFALSDDGTQFLSISATRGEFGHLNIHDIASGEVTETYTIPSACCSYSLNYDPVSNRLGYFIASGGGGGGPISPSLTFSVGGESYTAQFIDVPSSSVMWDFGRRLDFVGYTSDYSRFIVTDHDGQYLVYRNDSLDALIEWTCENRHVADLGDDLQEVYGITSSDTVCA